MPKQQKREAVASAGPGRLCGDNELSVVVHLAMGKRHDNSVTMLFVRLIKLESLW